MTPPYQQGWWFTRRWRFNGRSLKVRSDLLRTAVGFHGIAVIGILAGQIDRLAVVQTSSHSEIGFYLVAAALAGMVGSFIQTAVTSIALPALVSAETRRPAAALRLLRMTWALSLPLSVATAIVAPFVVPILFGSDFAPAGLLTSALSLAGMFLPVRHANCTWQGRDTRIERLVEIRDTIDDGL